jgi:hypothetical protein
VLKSYSERRNFASTPQAKAPGAWGLATPLDQPNAHKQKQTSSTQQLQGREHTRQKHTIFVASRTERG